MPDPQLSRILEGLRASGFSDLTGARVTATVPIAERLLNEIVAVSLPRSGAIREATVHPEPDNRVAVRVKLKRPEFLPAVTVTLVVERQPDLPRSPLLVFRVTGLPGLLALAGPMLSLDRLLPPGVRLEGDRLTLDLAALLAQHGQTDLLRYADRLTVNSEAGRLVIGLQASVPG